MREMRLVFIVGCPRSGTSVIKKVLRTHPGFYACGIEAGWLLDIKDATGHQASPHDVLALLEKHHFGFGHQFTDEFRAGIYGLRFVP